MVTKKLDAFGKKMDFGPKNCIFGPKICIFLRYTYETPIFSGQTVPTQWDHKSPISWGNSGYLRFSGKWPFGRSADRFMAPIAQSGPFRAQKRCFLARNHFFVSSLKKNCYYHRGTPKRQPFCVTALQGCLQGAVRAHFWAKKWPQNLIFLRYTYITRLFWSQTDPTQWDHNIPISWGNSGYLWFSGRWPFGRSAGRFSAPIAQNGPFWAQKRCFFWPEINFLWTASKKLLPSWRYT